jgi:hypothetical protein
MLTQGEIRAITNTSNHFSIVVYTFTLIQVFRTPRFFGWPVAGMSPFFDKGKMRKCWAMFLF